MMVGIQEIEGKLMTNDSRRAFLVSLGAFAAPTLLPRSVLAQSAVSDGVMMIILDVELRLKARLGVMLHDLETGKQWLHRADERFPLTSTFKAIAGLPFWPWLIKAPKTSTAG
jgi:beta-lactamase class A